MTSTSPSTDTRVQRWESASEWPLTVTAVCFLVAYAWPILNPDLPESAKTLFRTINLLAWAIFIIDYVVRLALAERRFHYWSYHMLDLAVIALPLLRPMRLLRLVMLLKAVNRTATSSLRGRIAVYVAGGTSLLLFCGALAVLDAERGHPGANIVNFGDAAWWAVVTVSTVGYGDRYPVTTEGRVVAVGLMLGGIALLGVVTASIASWLIDRVQEAETAAESATRADVAALALQVAELHRILVGMQAGERVPDHAPARREGGATDAIRPGR